MWTIPTLGIFVSSFRQRDDIATSGWWNVFPHREWETVQVIDPRAEGLDATGVMEIEGVSATFEELRAGIETPGGRRLIWVGNRRIGNLEIQEQNWTVTWDFTLDNYQQVLGFAWMKFPGRKWMFVMIVALLAVPLQIALVPILRDYRVLGLNGTFLGIWLAHTGFGLALATYLLYNYVSTLPRETMESAFIDGASHFKVFTSLILPLSVPALASFAIFQFLWVWNDYLVALIFLGGNPEFELVTQRMAAIVGSRGSEWHLLTAGAFVSMVLPLAVFLGLQRYFVRGLLAGSVKG
jgi:alpha-glucoside transport system permease protein